MVFISRWLVVACLAASLVACQPDTPIVHQTANNSLDSGGMSHPVQSHRNVPIATSGVLLGAWGDRPICTALDDTDRMKDRQAEQRACAAPLGQKVTWNNPDSGASGTIVAVRDGYDANGAYCRDFQQTIMVAGKEQNMQCKACQRPDGTWQVVP